MKLEVDAPDGSFDPQLLKKIILAMAPDARVKIFTPIEKVLPSVQLVSHDELAFKRLADAVAHALMEAPATVRWKDLYLPMLLLGRDSSSYSKGEAQFSPRVEAVAFSRYLKKFKLFSDLDKPAEHLAHHKRMYFSDGSYKSVEYSPTKLGKAVLERLKAAGWSWAKDVG
jgi:hypothetical protein